VNIWFHTLFLLGDIALGALFAFISFNKNWGYQTLERLSKTSILAIYAGFILSLLFYHNLFDNHLLAGWINLIIEKMFYAVILSFFIFEQNFCKNSFFKFGRLKTITYLGVISYGLFCFHEIGLLIGNRVLNHFNLSENVWAFLGLKPLIAFLVILPLSHLSWNYFEKPILRLKKRFYTK
ncbi:MAG: acyltransferase family protein, partial [Flavobacteriales bacterium]